MNTFLFIFILGNIGFPFTANFIAEIFTILSIAEFNYKILIRVSPRLFVSIAYSMWMYTSRAFNSNLQKPDTNGIVIDLNRNEFRIRLSLTLTRLVFGLKPNIILN